MEIQQHGQIVIERYLMDVKMIIHDVRVEQVDEVQSILQQQRQQR